jgi:hypothetical protein
MKQKSAAEPELEAVAVRVPSALVQSGPGARRAPELAELEVGELPGSVTATEPLAVFLHWLVLGVAGSTFALLYPLSRLVGALSGLLPRWSQVCGGGAIVLVLLALLERTKLDRPRVGAGLGLGAALLTGLALDPELLRGFPVEPGWCALLLGGAVGLAQLLFVEDWVAGRAGPRFRLLALALRDCATLPWWFWFSRRALALRAHDRQWQSRLREQREREWVARKSAEDLAEQLAAEHRAGTERLAAAEAAEGAATAERRAADERRLADEAIQQAAEVASVRANVELKLAQARATTEELNRHAEASALERTRLRREQLEAECRFIEAASAAQVAAANAVECGAEAARAQALLERIQDELALVQDPEPRRSPAYS